MHISIISPVYRAENTLTNLISQIESVIKEITDSYEIILVEDCGPDNSRSIIESICKNNKNVKGIFLSRNFGQQYALAAGFDYAQGDWVVTLDCDLQDNPCFIKNLYDRAQQGYDIVYASRATRQDSFFKKIGSKIFNNILEKLTDTIQDSSIANYVLYNKKVVDAIRRMNDYRRYYPLMNHWVGFKSYTEPIKHEEREDGISSSYTIRKRISLALNTILAFSDKPLRLMLQSGLFVVLITAIIALYFILRYLIEGITVNGWLTLFISIWFALGIQVVMLGLVGIYIGKIYEQVKGRPSYIISELINIDER